MSKKLTREELKKLIDSSLSKLSSFINELSKTDIDSETYKKSGLIAYWLIDYIHMLRKEKTFDSKKLLKYNRGDIISVNFGYRIGSELGGRHFAVVIDNYNNLNSGVVTVLPLTSKKAKSTNTCYSYELKHGLYELHSNKLTSLTETCFSEIDTLYSEIETSTEEKFESLTKRISNLSAKLTEVKSLRTSLEKLKDGTIVNFGQITTISKLRILNPKKASDSLNKIRLLPEDLDEINDRLKYLYIYRKY